MMYLGVLQGLNHFGRTMALGSIQSPNRNEYKEYFLRVKAAGA